MDQERTVVDVFQEVLQVPFEPRYITRLDVPILRNLSEKVEEFYTQYRVPTKSENELRPYLFHRYTPASSIGIDYYTHPAHFKNGVFEFDPKAVGDLTSQLKTYLLYCHGVCVHDPLPALLDYFKTGNDREPHALARIPAVTHLLRQYADVAPLLKHRILIPISDETPGFGEKGIFLLDQVEKTETLKLVRAEQDVNDIDPEFLPNFIADLGGIVKQQWWIKEQANENIDMYFPNEIYISIFKGLLLSLQERFAAEHILEPFNIGMLGQVSSIDPGKIKIQDILQLRQANEFKEFRSFLRGVFDRLHNNKALFSDFETEFASAVRREAEMNVEKIKRLTDNSNVLKDAFWNTDRLLIGAATGGFAAAVTGSATIALAAGAAGAASRILYDIVRGAIARSPNASSRASFRNHFLAVKVGRRA